MTCISCKTSYPNAIDAVNDYSDRTLVGGDCVCTAGSRTPITVSGQ